MNIRTFNKDDYAAILNIYSLSKLDELLNEKSEFKLLPLQDDKRRRTQLLESQIFVSEDNGVIAYGALYQSEIRALFVHPAHRGKGVGKALLTFLLSKISGTASLSVAQSNFSAKNLYRAYGFEIVEEFETSYNGVPVIAEKMICKVSQG